MTGKIPYRKNGLEKEGQKRGSMMKTNYVRNKGKRREHYVSDYVVFDLETTGISPARDAIIEISALKVEGGIVVEEFSTLVNPHRHIPAGATAVNGITDEMVADAPDLQEVMEAFLRFIGNRILVGHNIHTFDTNFVYDAALELFGQEMKNDYVDTLYLARRCIPQLAHHTLGDVSAYFGIDTKGAHRALNDCYMNQKCFEQLGKLEVPEMPETDRERCCPVCGCLLVKRSGRFGKFYGCSGFPECRFTQNI